MLRGVSVRQVDSLLHALYQHQSAVLQRLSGYLLTGQQIELTVHLGLNIEDHLLRCGDEEYLRVDAVLSLRQQVGSHKLDVSVLVGNHADL